MSWNDFNDAESQYDLIPSGTIAKVRMNIKPGGYDDYSKGWEGGYATQSEQTGSIYLYCEFVILEGAFAKRKVWSMIGLESSTGKPEWGNMGRSFIRAILNSARGISDKDNSPQAQNSRKINSLSELDGIEFLAKIEVKDNANEIRFAVSPDSRDYKAYYGLNSNTNLQPQQPQPQTGFHQQNRNPVQHHQAPLNQTPNNQQRVSHVPTANKPSWA
ncbi:MAG: hypothetical protein SFT90_07355 [Rickettsiales bacterium]|nr:hypothetical protein [Rickettsiales bacterium]